MYCTVLLTVDSNTPTSIKYTKGKALPREAQVKNFNPVLDAIKDCLNLCIKFKKCLTAVLLQHQNKYNLPTRSEMQECKTVGVLATKHVFRISLFTVLFETNKSVCIRFRHVETSIRTECFVLPFTSSI